MRRRKFLFERALWRKPLEKIRAEILMEELPRTLELWDLIMIGIGGTVGTGVFATAGMIVNSYAGPAAILSWLISGIGCLFSGVAFMELSTIVPSSGSTYAYAYSVLGELAAMIAGFLLTLEYGVASAGGARSWSDKLEALLATGGITGPRWMKSNDGYDFYAAFLLLVCTGIVCSGMSTGKKLINFITSMKICVVFFIILVGLFHFDASHFTPFIPPSERNDKDEVIFGISGIMLGASASFYGYIGYDEVCCLAGEAKDPIKAIPKAVLATVLGACFLSTMATFALVGIQSYSEINSQAAYGEAFASINLTNCKRLVELGEVLTMPVGVLIGFLAQPRLQFAMAKDGLLPAIFAKVDANGNPIWGTVISGSLLTLTALTIQFSVLWDFISLGILVAFNMTNLSLLLVRTTEKRPQLARRLSLSFFILSFFTAMLWQKGVIAHSLEKDDTSSMSYHIYMANFILASFLTMVCVVLVGSIWWYCPQTHLVKEGFRAPGVPLVPSIAIFFNWYLFAQVHWSAIYMVFGWILLAVLVYFVHGFLQHAGSPTSPTSFRNVEYEMVEQPSSPSEKLP